MAQLITIRTIRKIIKNESRNRPRVKLFKKYITGRWKWPLVLENKGNPHASVQRKHGGYWIFLCNRPLFQRTDNEVLFSNWVVPLDFTPQVLFCKFNVCLKWSRPLLPRLNSFEREIRVLSKQLTPFSWINSEKRQTNAMDPMFYPII